MSGVPYWIWKDFSEKEQGQFLGQVIQGRWLLVELDEATQGRFYNEKFAPLEVTQKYEDPYHEDVFFRIYLASIDDGCLSMWWRHCKMNLYPNQAEQKIMEWLNELTTL